MVAVSDFHNSLYAFAFGVLPSHRKQVRGSYVIVPEPEISALSSYLSSFMTSNAQGFGRRLMFAVEALAVERGFGKVSASVDSCQARLLQHYIRLGGVVEENSEFSSE
jgi:hypothetical protein